MTTTTGEQRRPGDAQTGSAAERRHLTALFCDLVDSTALSASLDPEDYQEIIRRYRSVITDAAGSQGGFVAQYRGDGALIYFGFPAAHEDDAEREPVEQATGEAVVGPTADLTGPPARQERGADEVPDDDDDHRNENQDDASALANLLLRGCDLGVDRLTVASEFHAHTLAAEKLRGPPRP